MSRRYGPFDPFEGGRFEIPTEFQIPRPTRRFWVGLGLIAAVIVLLLVIGPVINFWTEVQWYQALGLQDVYVTRVGLQFWLFWGSMALALLYAGANVLLALRLRGGLGLRTIGIRRRYLRTAPGAAGMAAAAVVALLVSGGAASQWPSLTLFLHASPAGVTDPVFDRDVSFYMLTLPFLQALVNWALGVGFLTLVVIAALYVWRRDAIDLRLSPAAIAHLSGLMAFLAAIAAIRSWIRRFELVYPHGGGVVTGGAGFTDLNARMLFAVLGAVLGAVLCLLLVANIRLRRLAIPAFGFGAWVALGLLGALYPAIVQAFVVAPSELSRERPYIEREIQFTRRAYALDNVRVSNYSGDAPLTRKAIDDDRATIDNLRLWDHRPLADTYGQLQTIRTYYSFNDIDLDRYMLDGRYQQLELSARELDTDKLPRQAQTWVNQKLTFTHGYGIAASPVNAVFGEGLPQYVARDLPPAGSLKVDRPAIYFGEVADNYVFAPSGQQEFDYPLGGQDVYASYTGTHSVRMDGTARLLWSFRTRDFSLLISPQIQDRTQILFRRNIVERARAIAPFLVYDPDPYIVASNGRLYWILDAYTVSNRYPYSQTESEGALQGVNYIRNSVKVVVDAYEGTADFYVADPKDPIVRAYRDTFPAMFKSLDQMPTGLRSHIRVPELLFSIQADIYRTYHMSDPRVFYNREDVWAKANEQTSPEESLQTLQPYYVLMRLPGEARAEYLLILPFTPNNKQNMISWLAARNDAPNYGQLVSYQLPKDKVVFGPQQIANRIQVNPRISSDFTLFNRSGSKVQQGNLLVVPIGDTFLYFEPVYLRATGAQSLPELKKVILADARQVVYENTLQDALSSLTGQQAGPSPTPSPGAPPSPPPSASPQVQDLARQALSHYQSAQDKLKAGDLAGYAQEMQVVGQLLQQMNAATGASPSPGATPSPGASPSPAAGSPRPSP
jgi:uncharacterized membrane protein (UPF0182 family)